MRIAVLALQGAFIEHEKILQEMGVESFEIRQKKDLDISFDGLILPGGESTVMGRLLKDLELLEPLKERILAGMPVLGTCAGLILLAEEISDSSIQHLGTLPVTVKRNAYGRQLGSFCTTDKVLGIGDVPMVFIRAPYIERVSPDVEILARVDGNIVAVRYHNQIATAFHPELTDNYAIHELLLHA